MSHSEDIPSLQTAAQNPEEAMRFHEVYEIVTTVEIVHRGHVYRVEVLRSYTRTDDRCYSTRVYIQEDVSGIPHWKPIDIGYVYREDVDSVLAQTLGFLRGRTHRTGV